MQRMHNDSHIHTHTSTHTQMVRKIFHKNTHQYRYLVVGIKKQKNILSKISAI